MIWREASIVELRSINGDQVTGGTILTSEGATDSIFEGTTAIGGLGNGVACMDGHTGSGYILYSEESVHTRFSGTAVHGDNAENFACAVYDSDSNEWSYDTNGAHVVFNPVDTDLLVAAVDFTSPTT